jgi:hypothetical protein
MTSRPSSPFTTSLARSQRARGFALIITISLLAFLLVLLLALGSSLKVGTQVVAVNQAEVQAQQNALAAVQMAMGQLQRFTGPDQRVTAPAEFADTTALASGSQIRLPGFGGGANIYAQTVTVTTNPVIGLPATLFAGSRYWTGVWGNSRPAMESYRKTPTPWLLTWLVSGNESVNYESSAYSGGQITKASLSSTIPFRPDMPISGLTLNTSYGSTLTIGGVQAVLLVGPGSVSQSPTLQTLTDAYVVAPLVPLSISSQLVPGQGSGANKVGGRIGWVVLDEGVKAKANLQDIYDGNNNMNGITSTNIAARVRMQVAQRNGIELVPGFADVASTTSIAYPVNTASTANAINTNTSSSNIGKVHSLAQLRSLDPQANSTTLEMNIRRNFHNLTVHSAGVLSDTLRGGLRLDLTSLLDDGPDSMTPSTTYSPSDFFKRRMMNLPILPTVEGASYINSVGGTTDARLTWLEPSRKDTALTDEDKEISPINRVISNTPVIMPTWDILNSWYDTSAELTTSTTSTFTGRIGTASTSVAIGTGLVTAHIAPVLTQARMYVKIFPKQIQSSQVGVPPGTVTYTYAASYSYNIFVAFALGNPYSAAMSLPRLEFTWIAPDFGTYSNSNLTYSLWRSPNNADLSTNIAYDSQNGSTPQISGATSRYGLIPRGKVFRQRTVSNSWNLKNTSVVPGSLEALVITGLNLEPFRNPEPTKPAAMGNFSFITQPVVIPAGGIVGFQVNPSTATTPGNSLLGSTQPNLTIDMTTVTVGSANTMTSAFYTIEPGTISTISFTTTEAATGARTLSFGPYLQAGTTLSVYVRPYIPGAAADSNPGVYTALLNHAWISNDVANTPNHGDTFSLSTGGSSGAVNVGGYRIYLPGPLTPVTTSVSWREDNSDQRINNPFPPYGNVMATGPGVGAPITSMTHGNVITNVPAADNGQGAWRVMADFNMAGQYKVTPWVSTGNAGMGTAPPYAGQYVAGTSSLSDIGFNFGNGYHAQRGATDSFSSMFLHWPPVWGPHYFRELLKAGDSSFTTISSPQAAVVLFDLPRRSSINNMPILSLGYLQHANLTADDQYPFVGHQPGNAVGNSLFHPLVSRTMTKQIRPNVYYANNANSTITSSAALKASGTNYFDMSYLLNTALWDRYYFSGIPQVVGPDGVSAFQSANPRLKFAVGVRPTAAQLAIGPNFSNSQTPTTSDAINPTVNLPKEYAAARYLLNDGQFNINSTSVEAWIAVLAGQRKRAASHLLTTPLLGNMVQTGSTAFPRTLYQPKYTAGAAETMNNNTYTAYAGFRWLTDAQIYALATTLVQEIRLRGPFVSLSHFVNRTGLTGANGATKPLVQVGMEFNGGYGGYGNGDTFATGSSDPNSRMPGYYYNEANTVQVAGALQMAIDRASSINTANLAPQFLTQSAFATSIAPPIMLTARSNMRINNNGGMGNILSGMADETTRYGLLPSTVFADALPGVTITKAETIAPGNGVVLSRAYGIPGWLTQADILQAIGPNLSARSDTFVIRAYGDALDLVNTNPSNVQPRDILARAWCEAVVQRFPDYVDPSNPASLHPSAHSNGGSDLQEETDDLPITAVNQAFGRRYRIVSFRWLTKDDI